MELDVTQLAQAVMRLPVAVRAELATRLLESLDDAASNESPESVALAWEAELERRDAELASDPSLGIPAGEVFARLYDELAAARVARETGR